MARVLQNLLSCFHQGAWLTIKASLATHVKSRKTGASRIDLLNLAMRLNDRSYLHKRNYYCFAGQRSHSLS